MAVADLDDLGLDSARSTRPPDRGGRGLAVPDRSAAPDAGIDGEIAGRIVRARKGERG